jgi:aspartate/tyrosine/aromatic aminotransferase
MFNSLQQQPADKILALVQLYKEDPRENKIDLWCWRLQRCVWANSNNAIN